MMNRSFHWFPASAGLLGAPCKRNANFSFAFLMRSTNSWFMNISSIKQFTFATFIMVQQMGQQHILVCHNRQAQIKSSNIFSGSVKRVNPSSNKTNPLHTNTTPCRLKATTAILSKKNGYLIAHLHTCALAGRHVPVVQVWSLNDWESETTSAGLGSKAKE